MARIGEYPKQRKLRNEMTGATNKGAKYSHFPRLTPRSRVLSSFSVVETRTSGCSDLTLLVRRSITALLVAR
jgi:hypothetical protein